MQPSHESSDRTHRPLLAQSAYYVATGVFPFLSRRGFEALTGPKREWWLVQTVGALAAGSAASLAAIDVVYVVRRRIAPTYLIDAVIQVVFLVALRRSRNE